MRILFACSVLLWSTGAFAQAGVGLYVDPTAEEGIYPEGMIKFCEDFPQQCVAAPLKTISWRKWRNTLIKTNVRVNKKIKPRGDPPGTDIWKFNPEYGDCEDYALTKRMILHSRGIPLGAMRFAMTEVMGTSHLVLLVRTDKGDMVLDNLKNEIDSVLVSNYIWRDVQWAQYGAVWQSATVRRK